MIQLLQAKFGKGMKFGAVFAAIFVAELLFLSVLLHCYVQQGQAAKYALLCTILLLRNVCVCGMRKRVKNTQINTYIDIFNH